MNLSPDLTLLHRYLSERMVKFKDPSQLRAVLDNIVRHSCLHALCNPLIAQDFTQATCLSHLSGVEEEVTYTDMVYVELNLSQLVDFRVLLTKCSDSHRFMFTQAYNLTSQEFYSDAVDYFQNVIYEQVEAYITSKFPSELRKQLISCEYYTWDNGSASALQMVFSGNKRIIDSLIEYTLGLDVRSHTRQVSAVSGYDVSMKILYDEYGKLIPTGYYRAFYEWFNIESEPLYQKYSNFVHNYLRRRKLQALVS